MKRQGTQRLRQGEEMTTDSRLLVFAAFHDQADLCRGLADWGFDIEQIDNLILLELHQMAQMQVLKAVKATRKYMYTSDARAVCDARNASDRALAITESLDPPLAWLRNTRRFKSYPNKVQQDEWLALSSHDQVNVLKKDWDLISNQKQREIVSDEIRRIGWDKMPWVPGWTFRAVHFLGLTEQGYGDKARDARMGQDFTLASVARQANRAISVDLAARDGSIMTGSVVSAAEAERLVLEFVAGNDEQSDNEWQDVFLLGSGQWVALFDPTLPMNDPAWGTRPNVLLQQHMFDEVVAGLSISECGHWVDTAFSKQRDMSKELTKNAFNSFREWIDRDEVSLQEPWWGKPSTKHLSWPASRLCALLCCSDNAANSCALHRSGTVAQNRTGVYMYSPTIACSVSCSDSTD